jgi:hypothetical protein
VIEAPFLYFQFSRLIFPHLVCTKSAFFAIKLFTCLVNLYMARGKNLSVVFKSNMQHQGMLLPPDLNDLIATNLPVRVVNEVLEKVDISELIRQYKPSGTSSYHPRLLLKIVVYAYINNVYCSHKIEEAVSQRKRITAYVKL